MADWIDEYLEGLTKKAYEGFNAWEPPPFKAVLDKLRTSGLPELLRAGQNCRDRYDTDTACDGGWERQAVEPWDAAVSAAMKAVKHGN